MSNHSLEIGDIVTIQEIATSINFIYGEIYFFEEGSEIIEVLIPDLNETKEFKTNQITNVKREFKVIHIEDNGDQDVIRMSRIEKLYYNFDKEYRCTRSFSETDLDFFIYDGDEPDCIKISDEPTKNHIISLLDYRRANILWDGEPVLAYYPIKH